MDSELTFSSKAFPEDNSVSSDDESEDEFENLLQKKIEKKQKSLHDDFDHEDDFLFPDDQKDPISNSSDDEDEEKVKEREEKERKDKEYRRWLRGTEFPSDPSSEEEEAFNEILGRTLENRNTVGDIPMEYYQDYDHIGYNIYGQKIGASQKKKDSIEEFLSRLDDPNWKRTVKDLQNDKEVVLSKEQYKMITNYLKQRFPDHADPYEVYDIPDDPSFKIHPVYWETPRKEKFWPVPKWELQKIDKLVRALETGQLKLDPKEKEEQKFYDLWGDNEQQNFKHPGLLFPAPKMKLPSHSESYRPPEEYLFTEEEKEQWELTDPEDRTQNFVPQMFPKMRNIPAYPDLMKERFDRCVDLEMATRSYRKYKRAQEFLNEIEKLPAPSDFKPFPTHQSLIFKGHEGFVRSISLDPTGEFLCSGSEDCTMKVWEVSTGRCLKTWKFDDAVYAAAWNPAQDSPLKNIIAVASGNKLFLVNADVGSSEESQKTEDYLIQPSQANLNPVAAETNSNVEWKIEKDIADPELSAVVLQFPSDISKLEWHRKGDYLVSLSPESKQQREQLQIHQVSKKRSQMPFRRQKEGVEHCQFHPSKPFLFVATKTKVKIYNLAKVALEKVLSPGVRWISQFDIHPKGDNVILSSYDKKVKWFDLDLSKRPYKHLSYHKGGVRGVAYHRKYPLFASASDDLTLHIFHGQVFDDFTKNALIVPLKVLRGHDANQGMGAFDLKWHPHQPWLFSAGADGTIRLWTNNT